MEGRRSGALLQQTLDHCAPHSSLCAGGRHLFIWQPSTERGHFTALKGHSVNVKGPPCLATAASTALAPPTEDAPRCWESRGAPAWGSAVCSGALPAPPARTSVAGEEVRADRDGLGERGWMGSSTAWHKEEEQKPN